MKRVIALMLTAIVMFSFVGCDDSEDGDVQTTPMETDAKPVLETGSADASDIDIDLTQMSSTMIYSEVSQMMQNPASYMDKAIKMNGVLSVYTDESTGKTYYACIIKDATACCQQGIEFELREGTYPEEGADITVLGTFTTYDEGEYTYCQLKDSALVG